LRFPRYPETGNKPSVAFRQAREADISNEKAVACLQEKTGKGENALVF